MLSSLIKSALPHRFLYPLRRRFRDRRGNGGAAIARLASFFIGGILLAGVLLTVAAELQPDAAPVRGERIVSVMAATDGRAVADAPPNPPVESRPEPVATRLDPGCAAHAREKLTTGLTNYYLQRRLRPGATSDDAATTSSLTGVLAGPGDPAAATPAASCDG